MQKPKVIVIGGPTASGKTALSIELAKRINGEIISSDSMQIYKDMDIGTAKVTKEEMEGIKHYLIDVVSPEERYTVSDFKQAAEKAIEEILAKGKTPVIVGGTGLYVNSLIYGIEYQDIELDEKYRNQLEQRASNQGLEKLYEEAQKILKEGFDANIINLPYYVKKIAELKTERVTMPYRDGIIFLDKNTYYGQTDYEIEYEANSFKQGEIDFNLFLQENNISFVPMISKTKRAYNSKK